MLNILLLLLCIINKFIRIKHSLIDKYRQNKNEYENK
jgi:hypothetical protein